MKTWHYTKGLHEIGDSVYAYLQPDGSWGWSNAGLIVDGKTALLVDTLYDLKLTQDMLDHMRRVVLAASPIDIVVNTHANGDHCYGNQLVAQSRIIASKHTAEEMREGVTPAQLVELLKYAPTLGPIGEIARRIFGKFDFEPVTLTLPTETFEEMLTLQVGGKIVQLIEVGPAHTLGDTLVYLPGEKTIFTGDILFIGSHPVMWAGPTYNWLRACDRILALDVETIVPGHGPVTGREGVMQVKTYWEYLFAEAGKRYRAGMSVLEAAQDISMDRYATWTDGERVAVNVASIYRELSGDHAHPNIFSLFGQMAAFAQAKGMYD